MLDKFPNANLMTLAGLLCIMLHILAISKLSNYFWKIIIFPCLRAGHSGHVCSSHFSHGRTLWYDERNHWKKIPYTCELLDNRGRTALHLAAESGRTKAVKILLSSLAFQDLINEQENDEGNTAMHLAAIEGRYKVLILLAGESWKKGYEQGRDDRCWHSSFK